MCFTKFVFRWQFQNSFSVLPLFCQHYNKYLYAFDSRFRISIHAMQSYYYHTICFKFHWHRQNSSNRIIVSCDGFHFCLYSMIQSGHSFWSIFAGAAGCGCCRCLFETIELASVKLTRARAFISV